MSAKTKSERLKRLVSRGYFARRIAAHASSPMISPSIVSQSSPGSMPLPSMGQTKREKGGETFHGDTLVAERIERLCKGPNHSDGNDDEPQEKRRAPGDDSDDIPFRPPRTGEASASPLARPGRASAHEPKGFRYSTEGIRREIAKDRRIKPNEARLIHALLRGRG